MVYNWRVERLFPVDAQVAGDFLSHLEEQKGSLTPRDVVEAAIPDDSAIHPCFEWNDTHAAELYREVQARKLMGNIVVVKEVHNEQSQKEVVVRAFVNVPQPESRYVSIDTAMSDADMRTQVLNKALDELTSFRTKYSDLTELSEIFTIIDEMIQALKLKEE